MLNLFKKAQKVLSVKSDAAVIEEIHAGFDGAMAKRLETLSPVRERLSQLTNAKQLEALGFSSAKQVTEKNELRKSVTELDLLEYYQATYPHRKFITKEDVEAICGKYGLVWGETGQYKGDVPDKNIREMASRKPLKPEDELVFYRNFLNPRSRYSSVTLMDLNAAREAKAAWEKQQEESVRVGGFNSDVFNAWFLGYQGQYATALGSNSDIPQFTICAPLSDMEATGYRLEGIRLVREVKDPIVLKECRGGIYEIVTKWGLEASDPLTVNPNNN